MTRSSVQNLGFTLVEVVVALMILSFLSLFTVEAIQRALKTKVKVQGDIDKNSSVRDALRIMERDINLAFNYRDSYIELYNQTQEYRKKAAQTKKDPPPTNPPAAGNPTVPVDPPVTPVNDQNPDRYKLKEVKIASHFLGGEDSIDFTTLSNIRMMEGSPISSQAEIGYKIKPCRRRSNQQQSTKCLWRRISNYIHEDITRSGQETVLLENVAEFSLRYLGPGKDGQWSTIWYSNERGDDITKNKFPYAVEITLAVRDDSTKGKDKLLKMMTVASIRHPNNPPQQDKEKPIVPGEPTFGTQ